MTVKELIEQLSQLPEDMKVRILRFDPNVQNLAPKNDISLEESQMVSFIKSE